MNCNISSFCKKNILLAALTLATLGATAQDFRGKVGYQNVQTTRVGDSLQLKMTAVLDEVELNSNVLLTLVPKIVDNKGHNAFAFRPLNVARRTRAIVWKRQNPNRRDLVEHTNGRQRSVELVLMAPYSSWMNNASIEVERQVIGCASCPIEVKTETILKRGYAVANKEVMPVTLPVNVSNVSEVNFVAAYQVPEPETVKVRTAKFMARFNFRVARYELLSHLGNNREEFRRVDSVAQRILMNPDVKVQNVAIDGYASPEGDFVKNKILSYNRAMAFVNYLKQSYGLNVDLFAVIGHGEDWDGLIEKVRATEMPYKQQVLEVITADILEDRKKERLQRLANGAPYRYILDNIYPQLRRTEYQFTYQVRQFNLEEAIQRFKNYPEMLSLNEMYSVAQHYPKGSEERKEALKTAMAFYPDVPASRFNAIADRLTKHLSEEDAAFLAAYPTSPEQLNNLGIYYAQQGDLVKARACFLRAGRLPEAKRNLLELSKLEN